MPDHVSKTMGRDKILYYDINDYFARFSYQPPPKTGSTPLEVAWKKIGTILIDGRRLYVGDSWCIGADGVSVPVTPGTYEFSAECFSYGSDGRVARLRGVRQNAAPDQRKSVGEFSVDVASAGVIDAEALDGWADEHPRDYESWLASFTNDQIDNHAVAGFFPCPEADATMLYVSTGFGDGTYRVVSLLENNRPVGFEAIFLERNQRYFERTNHASF
jgi:hypothetical protein